MSLQDIKDRLNTVLGQIDNEKLTGDTHRDYKIRCQTYELYDERNSLKQQAFAEFNVML